MLWRFVPNYLPYGGAFVCRRIVYLNTRGRKPIFLGVRACTEDLQGAIPRAWCQRCGREVFTKETVCRRCKRIEGGEANAFV